MGKKCWIGKSENTIVLFYGEMGYNISSNFEYPKEYMSGWVQGNFKDITKEYLTNTKIKVASEEHSKFIQELAFSAGYLWFGTSSKVDDHGGAQIAHLYMEDNFITYTGYPSKDFYEFHDFKEIFLPLPPNYGEEEEDASQNIETKEEDHSTEVEIYWNEPLKNDYEEMVVEVNDGNVVQVKNRGCTLYYNVDYKTGYPIGGNVPEELSIVNDISNYRKVELICGKDIAAKLKEGGLINVD